MDLVCVVSGGIETITGIITLLDPAATLPGLGDGINTVAGRAWGAAILSFGVALGLGWRGTRRNRHARATRAARRSCGAACARCALTSPAGVQARAHARACARNVPLARAHACAGPRAQITTSRARAVAAWPSRS